MDALKEGKEPQLDDLTIHETQIELNIPALLPDDYIHDVFLRLTFYKRLSPSESIDEVIVADERDPESLGMQLAKLHQVNLAPFFLVEDDDGTTSIFTVYFQFVKEVLQANGSPTQKVA